MDTNGYVQQLTTNPYDRVTQAIGDLVFGNPANDQASLRSILTGQHQKGATYYQTLATGGRAYEALAAARGARARAMLSDDQLAHRRALPASIAGVYTNPQQAALVGDVMLSNGSPSLTQAGIFQNPNARVALGQAATDMGAGNFAGYNQQTALAAGKPYEPVRIEGSTLLPSGVPLGDSAFQAVATPVGQADIGAKNAQAGASDALTRLRNVKTAAGGFAPKNGKPSALSSADLKLLGDVVTDATAPDRGTVNAKGRQDLAMLEANPTAAMKSYLLQRQPLGGSPLPAGPDGNPNALGVPLANYAALPATVRAPAPTLGEAAVAAPASGTMVRTDNSDPLGAAAAGALASVDPSHALQPAQRDRFNNDPRVLTLQRLATKAITAGHADPTRVAAKLQQEYSAIGYSTGAGGG